MTLNEYQTHARRTSRSDMSQRDHLLNGVMGLCGEAGEVIDLIKKHSFQDGRPVHAALMDELGDVLWYIAEVASALDIDLETIAMHNVAKLIKRYPYGFDAERSLHREE